MRKRLAGSALVLVAALGMNARAQDADNDRGAGKAETVRGVIAGVTLEGETTIDYATRRARTAEMMFLTVVGSPDGGEKSKGSGDKDRAGGAGQGRTRHNVYVVALGPKTEVRDATAHKGDKNEGKTYESPGPRDNPVAIETLEVGDQVRVTFTRRELSTPGGGDSQKAWKHGRHRTYFGNATSVTILAEPSHEREADRTPPKDRDDDKDKVKGRPAKADDKK